GQFCPVAKALEVLDERWTLLVVRELLMGSRHWGELRRGVPRMSPSLLSTRLRALERAGVVTRTDDSGRTGYTLTAAGRELEPLVQALGAWGVRWVDRLGDEDLDPHLLMWDVKRTIAVESWPRGRTVVAFRLTDVAARASRWWLVVTGDEVDLCDDDPEHEPVATVTTTLRTLTQVWRGDRSWAAAVRAGDVVIEAPRAVAREVPRWIGVSTLAATPRP
ncbi:MAG: winged helix-turn-helix transcriptional regulator, partial [Phycicoccus sp.]